jgi:hypothetical protein
MKGISIQSRKIPCILLATLAFFPQLQAQMRDRPI